MIGYPSTYYMALFSGRDLVIQDGSILAHFCTAITCGYPLLSTLAKAFPALTDKAKNTRILKPAAFRYIFILTI